MKSEHGGKVTLKLSRPTVLYRYGRRVGIDDTEHRTRIGPSTGPCESRQPLSAKLAIRAHMKLGDIQLAFLTFLTLVLSGSAQFDRASVVPAPGSLAEIGTLIRRVSRNPQLCECPFTDSCNKKRICAKEGGLFTDSCGASFLVGNNCTLTPSKCKYKDACNGSVIYAKKGGFFTDSCPSLNRVRNNCTLIRCECAYEDACNGKPICGKKGKTITDSCPASYSVGINCTLTPVVTAKQKRDEASSTSAQPLFLFTKKGAVAKQVVKRSVTKPVAKGAVKTKVAKRARACDCGGITDACDKKQLCVKMGGVFTDSCRKSYRLEHNCKLTPLSTTAPVPKKKPAPVVPTRKIPAPSRVPSRKKASPTQVASPTKACDCGIKDGCNKKPICVQMGDIFSDSCGASWRLGVKCKLTRTSINASASKKPARKSTATKKVCHCGILDGCDRKPICVKTGGVFTDSCGKSWHLAPKCKIIRTTAPISAPDVPPVHSCDCIMRDFCKGRPFCAKKGDFFRDVCRPGRVNWRVGQNCNSVPCQCSFKDLHVGKTVCARVGETVTFSRGASYFVRRGCKLTRLVKPSSPPAPWVCKYRSCCGMSARELRLCAPVMDRCRAKNPTHFGLRDECHQCRVGECRLGRACLCPSVFLASKKLQSRCARTHGRRWSATKILKADRDRVNARCRRTGKRSVPAATQIPRKAVPANSGTGARNVGASVAPVPSPKAVETKSSRRTFSNAEIWGIVFGAIGALATIAGVLVTMLKKAELVDMPRRQFNHPVDG